MAQPTFALRALIVCMSYASISAFAEDTILDTIHLKSTYKEGYLSSQTTVASRFNETVKEIPQSVSTITQQRIEDQNLTTVDDALQQMTGVTVIENDSTQSQYRARGYSLNSSVDGISTLNSLSGKNQLDLTLYDNIETLKGASGILTGTGDLGGTVNLITKKPTSRPTVNLELSQGSWNNSRKMLDVSGRVSQTLKARLVLLQQNRDFFTQKTHQNKTMGYGVIEYQPTDQDIFRVSYTQQNTRTEAPYMGLPASSSGELLNIDRTTNPTPNWAFKKNIMNETMMGIEHSFQNGWTTKLRIKYATQDDTFLDTFANSAVDTETWMLNYAKPRHIKSQYENRAFDWYVGGAFEWFNRQHQIAVGYNYDDYQVKTWIGRGASGYQSISLFDPRISRPIIAYTKGSEDQTIQSGWYAQAKLKLIDPITLILGARVSDYESKSRDIAPSLQTAWKKQGKETGEVTPYLGMVYDLTSWLSAYGSYSNIFVPQNNTTAEGIVLKPRQGNQFEIGAKGNFLSNQLIGSFALFKLTDMNRAFADTRYPDQDYYIAAGKVKSQGLETEVVGKLTPNWDLSAGYTYFINKFVKDETNSGLPVSTAEPKHSFKLWNNYTFTNGFKLGLGLNALSEYYGSRGTQLDRKQGGYVLLNTSMSYPLSSHTNLGFTVNNLTDKKYYATTGGVNTYNIYGTPRNFTLLFKVHY